VFGRTRAARPILVIPAASARQRSCYSARQEVFVMMLIKYALLGASAVGFLGVLALLVRDLRHDIETRRLAGQEWRDVWLDLIRWRTAARGAVAASLCLLVGLSIVVVPAGMAGVRVSELWGTRPGTLYPGVHFVRPLVEEVSLYDTRERVLGSEDPKSRNELLSVQTREGLSLGLAITVRYRLDPQRLDQIHERLAVDRDGALVGPVVASAFREVAPSFVVREAFSTRREELRQRAAVVITRRLAADGIVVRDVLLRDVVLPPEYAKGLEELLLREQQAERMVYDVEIKEKEIRTTELEADAQKARRIKEAEAAAAVRVLQAKAEADAMQHTLPLKQKQIEQSRLEAQARKEATIEDAQAAADAKVIDSKAEVQKSQLMAGAEANRVRVMASANNERLRVESEILKENPLLIQKIVAERLSDKMQIMMVPTDGRDFFATDVLKSALSGALAAPAATPAAAPATRSARR
jgi:regulator of protease activity HflC (stomatin/prohibitin superfamily)